MFRETMEQSSGLFSLDDIEVAEILLELPRLILESEMRSGYSFRWGAKSKRSNVFRKKFAVKSLPSLKLLPSPPPPPPPPPLLIPDGVGSTYETEGLVEKVLTSSPATPLSFSPSESDEKPPPSQKTTSVNSLKRKKEQLLETMEDYTWRNELLGKEIESKMQFLDQQKAKNLELKAKKRKLSQCLGKVVEEEEEPRSDLDLQVTQSFMVAEDDHHQQKFSSGQYQQPFIIGHMEINKNSPHLFGQMISSWSPSITGRSITLDDNVGPIGLIDLNVPAVEEAFGFSPNESCFVDQSNSKARAAEARLKRMQICRSKNSNGASKVRLPYR